MIKDIVKDPVFLQLPSEKAERGDLQTARDLCDTLAANSDRCVGMAANMIGVRKTILAAVLSGGITVMINPVIKDHSARSFETEEGCLSLSGVRKAERYEMITVEYTDMKFKKRKCTLRGFEAQIVQHEIDHFRGVLI